MIAERDAGAGAQAAHASLMHGSLWIFPPLAPSRAAVISFFQSAAFEGVVLATIGAYCVSLALYRPLEEDDSPWNSVLAWIDLAFLILFTLELAVKAWAYGLVLHEGALLRDPWDAFDFAIVAVSWASMLPVVTQVNLTAARAARILRSLRTISGVPALRLLVASLLKALPLIVDLLALLAFIFVVLGVLAIQLWGGVLQRRCVDDATGLIVLPPVDIVDDAPCSTLPGGRSCDAGQSCLYAGENPNDGFTSFDNMGAAGIIILQTLTREGWANIAYYVMWGSSSAAAVFFVLLFFIGGFFVMNLLLAVINAHFTTASQVEAARAGAVIPTMRGHGRQQRAGILGNMFVARVASTTAANSASASAVASRAASPESETRPPPKATRPPAELPPAVVADKLSGLAIGTASASSDTDSSGSDSDRDGDGARRNCLRAGVYAFVTMPLFEKTMLCVVVLNTIALGMEHHGMDDGLVRILDVANLVFTGIFICEFLLKWTAFGLVDFWRDSFNVLDALIVIAAVVELFFLDSSALLVLRAFRLLRLVKIVTAWHSVRTLVLAVVAAVTKVSSALFLLCLFIFIYAVVGMQLFGGHMVPVPRHNFDSFPFACLTVFQLLTLELWNEVLWDAMRATHWSAAAYFVSLLLVGRYILLNLFAAILLQSFAALTLDRADAVADNVASAVEMTPAVPPMPALVATRSAASHLASLDQDAAARAAKGRAAYDAVTHRFRHSRSLFCLTIHNPLRRLLLHLVELRAFNIGILVLILANCAVTIVAYSYEEPPKDVAIVLLRAMQAFTIVFAVEAAVKIVAYGFVMHEHAYLRSFWNILDLVIVLISVTELFLASDRIALVQSVRALRLLHVSKNLTTLFLEADSPAEESAERSFYIVMATIRSALPQLASIALFALFFGVVLGILGVHLFNGRFYRCTDASVLLRANCDGLFYNADSDRLEEREWVNPEFHFDHLFAAGQTLGAITTLDGWTVILYQCMDGRSFDEAPQENARAYMSFYVVVVIIFNVFVSSMVIGSLAFFMKRQVEQLAGGEVLSERQRELLRVQQWSVDLRPRNLPPPPRNWLRAVVVRLVRSRAYAVAMIAVDVLNGLLLTTIYFGMSETHEDVIRYASIVFTGFFLLEVLLQLIAETPRIFVRGLWNWFDVAVVLASVLLLTVFDNAAATFLRLLRIVRLVKLVQDSSDIRRVLRALARSMLSLGSTGALLFVILHVYAMLGVYLFRDVRSGEVIDDGFANFRHYGTSLLTLLRMASGEEWLVIARDAVRETSSYHRFYFVTFNFTITFVLLNAIVAIVTGNFTDEVAYEQFLVKRADVERIAYRFVEHHGNDKAFSYFLPESRLVGFLSSLGAPFFDYASFLQGKAQPVQLLRAAFHLQVNPYEGRGFHYYELCFALINHVYRPTTLPARSNGDDKCGYLALRRAFPDLLADPFVVRQRGELTDMSALEKYAAIVVQRSFRRFHATRRRYEERTPRPARASKRGDLELHDMDWTATP